MFILHLAAVLAVLALARFAFLLAAPAMRRCRWCRPDSRWCLRCHGRREHFRLGVRTARRVRAALREAYREERARRLARHLGNEPASRAGKRQEAP